ncbi:MAG: aminopeptidase [Burkholderiaceae bacterium]
MKRAWSSLERASWREMWREMLRRALGTKRTALLAALGLAAAAFGLGACSSIGYYSQSIEGHLDILHAARPIDDWLDDPATSAVLRHRLERVRTIRRFAAHELGLPDNRSYTTYADLKRPFAVWSVFATPELSLRLKQWCFPVVGCVAYRGYYSKDDADLYAEALRESGDDVYVGGVPAYSTLGYTTDPVLSTFIGFPEGEVARLIFHELAHQVVYVQGDTAFNESFAVAVEEEGVRRWFALQGADNAASAEAYRQLIARKRVFVELLARHRKALESVYASPASVDAKRVAKQNGFAALHADYESMKRDPASPLYGFAGYDRYFAQALNNANLAAVATYTQRVPAFAKLLAEANGDLPRFYQAVRGLAQLPVAERNAHLDALIGSSSLHAERTNGKD